tara:strand:+ start:362 stop:1219 length:858 start_codon:yes stop_codon:yes gene_type:complete
MSRAHALAARAPTSDDRKRWRAHRSSSSRRLETRASSEASVRARGVSYAPAGAGTPVLVNVDATLPKRGLTLIVGRSGAGKSTLLTLIAGLSEPTSGTLEVGEEAETTRTTPAAERARRTGIVFQFPERHFLGRTVMQELTFGWPTSANAFASRRELAYRMNDALHAVGMERVALDTEVRTLSGGYKRRLALAIQLVRNPRVLCLDEPLAGLDWQTRAELTALLDELKRDRAVVVVSHDVEEIQPITDRAFRMTTHGALTDVSDELAGARARAYGEASDAFPSFD